MKFKILKYGHYKLLNDDIWEQYKKDFVDFIEDTLKAYSIIPIYNLQTFLRY